MYPIKVPVSRSAVIISSPGPPDNYLEGTSRDIENMFIYLSTPRGGLWQEQEIFPLDNPTWAEAWQLIDSCTTDYVFIYFSGHGCSEQNGRRYLLFNDGLVEDTSLFNNSRKQLIIADSCRTHIGAIGAISPADEDWSSFTGESWAREVFDDHIRSSQAGKMIVHATHDGSPANDLGRGKGGAFTISLLMATIGYKSGHPYSAIGIKQLLPLISTILNTEGIDQLPGVAFETGNLTVPFLIDADQTEIKHKVQKQLPVAQHLQPSNPGLSLLGGIAITVAIFGLLGGFDD